MKYEDLFCTLEQAKKFRALGVDQRALFYYYEEIRNGKSTFPVMPLRNRGGVFEGINDDIASALKGNDKNAVYAAYMVQELASMLPPEYYIYRDATHWYCWRGNATIMPSEGKVMTHALANELLAEIDLGRLTVSGINEELLKGSRHA
jgi:hypothetical protein